MDALSRIAESRILEAQESGAFEDLAGAGRPLELEDLSGMAPHLRPAWLVLRSAGVLPEEMQLRQRIVELRDILAACTEELRRGELNRELGARTLRYELLKERRRH